MTCNTPRSHAPAWERFNHLLQQIKHLRLRPRRRFQPLDDPPLQQIMQFRSRLIQITEIDRTGRAGRCAPRIQSLLDPVVAESALIGVPFRIDEPGVIRAGRDTSLTPGAFLVIHQYRPVVFLIRCSAGTDEHTGRIITVIAPFRTYLRSEIGEFSRYDFGYPIACEPVRDFVFHET